VVNTCVYTVRLLPRCTVGSRQAEHESQGESIEEDDMVMRVGNVADREASHPTKRATYR